MGRKTDALLRGFRAAKCLTLLKLATARIKVLRNKRSVSAKQMRLEIAQLLKSGQDAHVYNTMADALIKQENIVAFYDIIDQYCHTIIGRFPMIESQSKCPIGMKEPIATLIFAAPRCVELSELASIKEAFTAKYGKEFAAAAAELRPDCGVNKQVIELLSTRPATGDMKLKLMKEICGENNVNWTPGEALVGSSTNMPAGSSQQPVKTTADTLKVAGDAGSSKATIVVAPWGVSEAAPSKSALQGGLKHEVINKSGLAPMEPLKQSVLATDASKSSAIKQPGEDVGKTGASVPQSIKGATNTVIPNVKSGLGAAGSLKLGDGAVLAANAFKRNDTKEEGMGTASLSTLQSLKGVINTGTSCAISGSFKEAKGEPVAKAEAQVQTVVAAQEGMSDSDDDSFVSVEEGKLEDDAEVSLIWEAVRRESSGKDAPQMAAEADGNGPGLIKKPSIEIQETRSSLESSHEDFYSNTSCMNNSSTMESLQEDSLLKVSSKNSSNTDAPMEEKDFSAESRKSSLREEKSSGWTEESSLEDALRNASSKNSMNTDTLVEEKIFRADSRKSSLREKQLAKEQSLKQERGDSLIKQQLEEEGGFEPTIGEGVQRKDRYKDVSIRVTTENSETLVDEHPFEEQHNRMATEDGFEGKGISEDISITESSLVENIVERENIESFPDGISAENIPFGAGESAAGKEAFLNIKKSSKIVSKPIDDVPALEKGVQEMSSSACLGALATPDDFATAAKAIAAEAARIAVLDYAKQIAGSSAIPVDLTDFTNLGLDFVEGSQVTEKLHNKGESEPVCQEVWEEGDITNDVIKDKTPKAEIAVIDDECINSHHEKIDEMSNTNMESAMHSKMPMADDGADGDNANSKTMLKDESLQEADLVSGNDSINPFAIEIDKAMNSLFSEVRKYDDSFWVNETMTGVMSKAGVGQEDDHLDIFFKRKTPRFDEDGYSLVKVNTSFLEEKLPYLQYEKKESILQDKVFVPTPVFDSFPERPHMVIEDSSGSFNSPVFDEGVPETFDGALFFDDGFDKSTLSFSLSDQKRPHSPSNLKVSSRFDPETEPSFDEVADEEEQSSIEKNKSTQVGQLKWHSKKPMRASGEMLASDTSIGGPSNPVSRRTRKQHERVDEYAYDSGIPAQAKLTDAKLTSKTPQGSFNPLLQQQQKKQSRYDVGEEGNLRTRPAEPIVQSGYSTGIRQSSSPKRVSNQHEYYLSKESQPDRWDSSSSVQYGFPTSRTKSAWRLSQHQKVPLQESDEYFDFNEEIDDSSAFSSMGRRTTRVAKQQLLPQDYKDEAQLYGFSNKPSKMINFPQNNMVDDDSKWQPAGIYKPFRQSDDPHIGTSANSAIYRQNPHRQEEDYKPESVHLQHLQVNSAGNSNPTSRFSDRRKHHHVEEEDLDAGYKSPKQVNDLGKSLSVRPLSSRTKTELEEPRLLSRYMPSAHVNDLGRVSLSPLSGCQQGYQLSREEEQEVSMEKHEREEYYSMPLPDLQQRDRFEEKQRVPRSRYGQKQNMRLEKKDSNSSTEDYEQEQEEKQQQHRSSPASGHQQEQQRPSSADPPQQSLLEEVSKGQHQGREKPSPVYTQQQEIQEEKKSLKLSMEHLDPQKEEQLHHPTVFPGGKQEQGAWGNEKQPWPLHRLMQESEPEKESLESWQQQEVHYMQDKLTFGWKQQSSANEKHVKGQREKSELKVQLPARQSLSNEEGVKGSGEKTGFRRSPSSAAEATSSPLESCISDPVILATIPPPVKKPVVLPVPAAIALESSVSAPSPTSVPEVKGLNVPPKPPNVEDLFANFEAFRRARKGE